MFLVLKAKHGGVYRRPSYSWQVAVHLLLPWLIMHVKIILSNFAQSIYFSINGTKILKETTTY